MKFYRLHVTKDCGVSYGYEWFTSKAAAKRQQQQNAKDNPGEDEEGNEITEHEIKPTKAGILDALNRYADYPNNG